MTQRKIVLSQETAATLRHCWWMVVFALTFNSAAVFAMACFTLMWRGIPVRYVLGPRAESVLAVCEIMGSVWLGVLCYRFLYPKLLRFFRATPPPGYYRER